MADEIPEEHVSAEDIARLAEGTLPPETSEVILVHLSRCRSCMAAYVEAVRYRAAWLANPDAFEPPKDVLERGRALFRSESRTRRSRGRQVFAAGSMAAAASILVAMVLYSGRSRWGTHETLPQPIARALAQRTHLARGLFLPGAQSVRAQPGCQVRGNPSEGPDAMLISQAVDSLRTVYEQEKG